MSLEVLDELFEIIQKRKSADPEASYTARLFAKGRKKIVQKLGEEAVEAMIDAVQGNTEGLTQESADLLYHLLVTWAEAGLTPQDVAAVVRARMSYSGIDARKAKKGGD